MFTIQMCMSDFEKNTAVLVDPLNTYTVLVISKFNHNFEVLKGSQLVELILQVIPVACHIN